MPIFFNQEKPIDTNDIMRPVIPVDDLIDNTQNNNHLGGAGDAWSALMTFIDLVGV